MNIPTTENLTKKYLKSPELIDEAIAVFYWGRSGSYLLCSLLEGHSHLVQLPVGDFGSQYTKLDQVIHQFAQYPLEYLANEIADIFPYLFSHFQSKEDYMKIGDEPNEHMGTNRNNFIDALTQSISALREKNICNRSNLIKSIHIAYYASQKKVLHAIPKIVLSLHTSNEEILKLFFEDFPKAKVLTCVRLPEKTLDSHFRHHLMEKKVKHTTSLTYRLIDALWSAPSTRMRNTTTKVVRFEDIHRHTESLMKELASWLKIPWEETLLQSTMEGKKFWFKSNDHFLYGTNPKVVQNTKCKNLNILDRFRIRLLFQDHYNVWGYSCNPYPQWIRRLLIACTGWIPYKFQFLSLFQEISLYWDKKKRGKCNFLSFLDWSLLEIFCFGTFYVKLVLWSMSRAFSSNKKNFTDYFKIIS